MGDSVDENCTGEKVQIHHRVPMLGAQTARIGKCPFFKG